MPLQPNEARDPDAVPIPCEADGCDAVQPRGEMFSVKLTYAMPGPGIAPLECGAIQHFGCCPEHAESAAAACLATHLAPMQRAQQARQQALARHATQQPAQAEQAE